MAVDDAELDENGKPAAFSERHVDGQERTVVYGLLALLVPVPLAGTLWTLSRHFYGQLDGLVLAVACGPIAAIWFTVLSVNHKEGANKLCIFSVALSLLPIYLGFQYVLSGLRGITG